MRLSRRVSDLAFTMPFLALLAACGASTSASAPTEPSAPTSGWLTLQLATPGNNDGAVQFTVTGPAIDSVHIVGYDGFAAPSDGAVSLIVVGQVTNGDVARIHIADLSATTQYHASIAAVAARGSYTLTPLDGYRAVLVR